MTLNKVISDDIQEILKSQLPWEELANKIVLVTGANGFIPSYIVETLLALKNVTVLALVRNLKKAETKFTHHSTNPLLKFIVHDVSESFNIDEKIDIIIHAASQASPKYYGIDPVGTLNANTLGTHNMLELARKKNVQNFLFFSSCEIYGLVDSTIDEIDETYTGAFCPTDVRSCYGESKRMGENMCVCYSHQYGIKTSIVRPAHTYGPGLSLDDGRVFCDFIKNVLNSQDILLNSDGKASRKFLYISDFIKGMFLVLFKGSDKEAYNITNDREISILDLAKLILSLSTNKNLSVRFAEGIEPKGYLKSESTKAGFVSNKLKQLGWKPLITEKDGFKRMMRSYE